MRWLTRREERVTDADSVAGIQLHGSSAMRAVEERIFDSENGGATVRLKLDAK